MHEYPITKQIIEKAEEFAVKNGADRVLEINLVVGDYSGYVSSSIDLYFPIIAEDTMCRSARLNIERVAPKYFCGKCNDFFTRQPFSFDCPVCGSEGSPTDIGKEFYIKSIIV